MFTGVSSSFRARKRFRAKTMGLALSDGAVVPPEAIGIRQRIRKTKENRHRQCEFLKNNVCTFSVKQIILPHSLGMLRSN